MPRMASRREAMSDRDERPVICQVLHTLHVGGGEILARAFALENEPDFRPVFALLDDLGSLGQELREADYSVEVIGRRPGFDLGCVRRLRAYFRTNRVSLIHAHQYGPLFYSALARWPAARIPVLFTEHGRDYPDFRRWKRVLANRFMLRSCDRFIAVGECVRQSLIAHEGLPPNRVEVIYNGTDLAAYDPNRNQRPAVRQELGLAMDDLIIMQVARLNHLKDHRTAIRAMGLIHAMVPRAKLIIVGEGEERSTIDQLIGELGLGDCIRMVGARRDIPRLLQCADVFLLSSISEGIPLTLIEAMATGLPCVATRVGGNSEVVEDGQTGFLAEPSDPKGLADKIAFLSRDAASMVRMGAAGRSRVERYFSDRSMHCRYNQVYRQMLGRMRRNGRNQESSVDESETH